MIRTDNTPILLVDDDPVFRQSLRIVLEQIAGEWICFEAGSVAQAVAILKTNTIALAVIDIGLPDGTAADVIRQSGSVPSLLCTQDDNEPTFKSMFADLSIAQNLVGYLIKPIQQGTIWSIRAGLEIGRERQLRNRLIADATARLEEERQLVAQNLHDVAGAAIAQLNWTFSNIKRAVLDHAGVSPLAEQVSAICSEGKKILADTQADIAQAITQLRPEAVSVAGLRLAVDDLVRQWRRSAPAVSFQCDLDVSLDAVDVRRAGIVYRLVQEGMTNVMRHTDPTHVAVEMRRCTQALVLTITSQGKVLVRNGTYKLTILRERTSSLGGVLQFSCAEEMDATRLVVTIPM